MPDWLSEIAKQVPSLSVLVVLVYIFLKTISKMSEDGKQVLSSIQGQNASERKDTLDSIERMSIESNSTTRDCTDALGELKGAVNEMKTVIEIIKP